MRSSYMGGGCWRHQEGPARLRSLWQPRGWSGTPRVFANSDASALMLPTFWLSILILSWPYYDRGGCISLFFLFHYLLVFMVYQTPILWIHRKILYLHRGGCGVPVGIFIMYGFWKENIPLKHSSILPFS